MVMDVFWRRLCVSRFEEGLFICSELGKGATGETGETG